MRTFQEKVAAYYSLCYMVPYNELPIKIYTEGDHIGYVNTFCHVNHGSMKEYFIQDGENSFARAFIPSNCTICYNCGFIRKHDTTAEVEVMCDECDYEYHQDMKDYYENKDITVEDCSGYADDWWCRVCGRGPLSDKEDNCDYCGKEHE